MIRIDGQRRRYSPGDWVEVGRHVARQWLADGTASLPGLDNAEALAGNLKDCAILVRGGKGYADNIKAKYWKLTVEKWTGQLIRKRNLIWDPHVINPTPKQAIIGFSHIDSTRDEYAAWDMAVMLGSGVTAKHYGNEGEKAKTEKVIGTLHVPIYNTGLIWMKRTPASKKLLRLWLDEVEAGADEGHAFIRALKQSPVLICTLPSSWLDIR
jgi:hypothetical protein